MGERASLLTVFAPWSFMTAPVPAAGRPAAYTARCHQCRPARALEPNKGARVTIQPAAAWLAAAPSVADRAPSTLPAAFADASGLSTLPKHPASPFVTAMNCVQHQTPRLRAGDECAGSGVHGASCGTQHCLWTPFVRLGLPIYHLVPACTVSYSYIVCKQIGPRCACTASG